MRTINIPVPSAWECTCGNLRFIVSDDDFPRLNTHVADMNDAGYGDQHMAIRGPQVDVPTELDHE